MAHSPASESEIVRGCLDLLACKRIEHFRINNGGVFDPAKQIYRSFHGTKGVPDIIAILPMVTPEGTFGIFCGIEVKTKTGKQSQSQREVEEKIIESGGYYLLVRSSDELEEDLKTLGY